MRGLLGHSIAGRLYLVGGLALAAVTALAAVSIYFAGNTGRAAELLYNGTLVGAVEAAEIELLLEKHRRVIEAAPLEFDRKQIAGDRRIASSVSARIEKLIMRSDPRFAERVSGSLPELWQLGKQVLDLAENFAQDRALPIVAKYIVAAEATQGRIRSYRREKVELADREVRMLVASARRLVNSVTGIALLASLLIGPLALILLRGMVLRLDRVTDAMRRLAHNDTSVTIAPPENTDEIGEMERAMAVFKANAVSQLDHGRQLEQLNRWLDIALNNMARGLSLFDSEQRLVVSNAAYARFYELPDELARPGTRFADIAAHRRTLVIAAHKRSGDAAPAEIDFNSVTSFDDEASWLLELRDGRIMEVSVKPLDWGGWLALHEDVTERRQAAEKIALLVRQDSLTGLGNRRQFQEELERSTAGLAGGAGFALHGIDLDRFKEVNDTHGHPVGDALLVAVGRRLQDAIRSGDALARLGGDEFAILQRGVSRRKDVEPLARRIVEVLARPFQLQGHQISIGATVGVTLAPDDAVQASRLMKNADIALYRAKGERRGTYQFYDPAMENNLRSRRVLEADLGQAIVRNQLELHYQPIISLAERQVVGCEALIRWRHPERGMISPGEFIPLAEATGLINGIGAWALGEACRTAATWPQAVSVAVNLSAAQFKGSDLVANARVALADSGLAPSRLELEVTESLLLGDDPETLAVLHKLRDTGIAIALDDFGTGYSSLSLLRSFPFDKLKIDQSFVRDLPDRPHCEAIVGAVAGLAASLDMTTVAEGVETRQHLARVAEAGCDLVQGYLFSKPVPASDIIGKIGAIDASLKADARGDTALAV